MICAIVLLFLIFNNYIIDKVQGYIYAIMTWTLFCFGLTEILSCFNQVTTINLWIAWGIFDISLFFIILKKHMITRKLLKINSLSKTAICIIFMFMAIVLLFALTTVPYNWDSMTYHLSRIAHWYQNRSVAHYASNIARQITSPVLAELVNFNVYTMLKGNDRLVNLVQCFSYFTNGLLVYHITRKLGCDTKYCILACVLYFSMPIAFAEALTTQTDNFSAMYTLSLIYLLLDFCDVGEKLTFNRDSVIKVIMMGLCVSFGYLAKPSVGFAMMIFAMWLLIISILRRDSVVVILKLIVTALPGMVIVMMPEIWRNLLTFHALVAKNVSSDQMMGTFHVKYLVVNFIKNLTFNMPSAWLYDSSYYIYKYLEKFASWLNVDISDTTSGEGIAFFVRNAQTYTHDSAVNPIIVWVLILSVVMLLLMCYRIKRKQLISIKAGYYLASVLSFVVFCTILKWSPFRSRYMIAYFALMCPAVVSVIEWFMRNLKREKIEYGFWAIIWFCILTETFGMLAYHKRLITNEWTVDKYFANYLGNWVSYREATDYLNERNFEEIGLLMGGRQL